MESLGGFINLQGGIVEDPGTKALRMAPWSATVGKNEESLPLGAVQKYQDCTMNFLNSGKKLLSTSKCFPAEEGPLLQASLGPSRDLL